MPKFVNCKKSYQCFLDRCEAWPWTLILRKVCKFWSISILWRRIWSDYKNVKIGAHEFGGKKVLREDLIPPGHFRNIFQNCTYQREMPDNCLITPWHQQLTDNWRTISQAVAESQTDSRLQPVITFPTNTYKKGIKKAETIGHSSWKSSVLVDLLLVWHTVPFNFEQKLVHTCSTLDNYFLNLYQIFMWHLTLI